MGVAVSNYKLANRVSRLGQLGVISGVAMESVLSRRLQDGDAGGDCRRALAAFPRQDIARRILDEFFIEGGRGADKPYKVTGMYTLNAPARLSELTVAATFCEVWLAKEGHTNAVGMNLLEKIQLSNIYTLYGAMLGGVDYVLMGAGIPREVPGILDAFAQGKPAEMSVWVDGAASDERYSMKLDPAAFLGSDVRDLLRPQFLPIISSVSLGQMLKKRSTGEVNGFIVEHHSAGGHNAPPRGTMEFSASGEPVFGARDEVTPEQIAALGLPFWMAGHYGNSAGLRAALAGGASGVQVGTAFAFCNESGMAASLKRSVLDALRHGGLMVRTDAAASPTGFPFKVVQMVESIADKANYELRRRICDMGFLRQAFKDAAGNIGYRCPAAPVEAFKNLGGKLEETLNRVCLCNGLSAAVDMAQRRLDGYLEKPLVTAGTFIKDVQEFVKDGMNSYSAEDVIAKLLEGLDELVPATEPEPVG